MFIERKPETQESKVKRMFSKRWSTARIYFAHLGLRKFPFGAQSFRTIAGLPDSMGDIITGE